MDYIFIDIECANCFEGKGKIYSFGYAFTDENFALIENEDILINPDADFDRYVKKNILKYDIKIIEKQPHFSFFYNKIKNLLDRPNTIVVGFEVEGDLKFIKDECIRYNLDPFSVNSIDIRKLLRFYNKTVNSLGKEYEKWVGRIPDIEHRSDVDAILTLGIAKAICEKEKTKLIEFPEYENKKDKFDRFLSQIQKTEDANLVFDNKKICFSKNYENKYDKNLFKLVQLIANSGGTYVKKVSLADIFVTYDLIDKLNKICDREKYVKKAIEEGAKIEIVKFQDFLEKLNISEEKLTTLENINYFNWDNRKL